MMIEITKCFKSTCCNAIILIEYEQDFFDDKEGCTMNYTCDKCKQGCDSIEDKGNEKHVLRG